MEPGLRARIWREGDPPGSNVSLMAERMRICPAAKSQTRGATGSLAPRMVRGILINWRFNALATEEASCAPEFGGGNHPLLRVCPWWLGSHLVVALSWLSSLSGLRQWTDWGCARPDGRFLSQWTLMNLDCQLLVAVSLIVN